MKDRPNTVVLFLCSYCTAVPLFFPSPSLSLSFSNSAHKKTKGWGRPPSKRKSKCKNDLWCWATRTQRAHRIKSSSVLSFCCFPPLSLILLFSLPWRGVSRSEEAWVSMLSSSSCTWLHHQTKEDLGLRSKLLEGCASLFGFKFSCFLAASAYLIWGPALRGFGKSWVGRTSPWQLSDVWLSLSLSRE